MFKKTVRLAARAIMSPRAAAVPSARVFEFKDEG